MSDGVPSAREPVACPVCGRYFRNDNGGLLSDLDWHVLRQHGALRE